MALTQELHKYKYTNIKTQTAKYTDLDIWLRFCVSHYTLDFKFYFQLWFLQQQKRVFGGDWGYQPTRFIIVDGCKRSSEIFARWKLNVRCYFVYCNLPFLERYARLWYDMLWKDMLLFFCNLLFSERYVMLWYDVMKDMLLCFFVIYRSRKDMLCYVMICYERYATLFFVIYRSRKDMSGSTERYVGRSGTAAGC